MINKYGCTINIFFILAPQDQYMQRLPGYAQQGPYSNSPSYERTSPDSFPRGMHNPAMGDYPVGKLVLNLPFLALFMSQNYAFYSCLKMHFYWKKNTF